MKKAKIAVIILCILILCASCGDAHISLELALCGSYAVPGMFCDELKGGTHTCTILEYDQQGRILFEYTTRNSITNKEETSLVICQAIDDEHVYFYEDLCYLFGEFQESDISQLKANNDWDQPLDESKMSRRAKNISFDLYIVIDPCLDLFEVREVCSRKIKKATDQIKVIRLDADFAGHELYLLKAANSDIEELYFVISDSDYTVAIMEIKGYSFLPEELAAFKQANGWIYGF